MIMKGQKRKLPPEDVDVVDRSSPFWETQRQFVFSVSLNKYQRGQELPEPSLRRSVLIANTLRQVSLEACRAPSADPDHGLSALPGCPVVPLNNPSSCRSVTNSPASSSVLPLPVKDEDEDWGSMSMDSDFSLSAAISSILTALDSNIDQAAPRTPLRALENLSEGAVEAVKHGVRDCGGGWGHSEESRSGCSYLGDLTVEDLFQDIDTSLLERDMCVLGRGDELLRYLPPLSSASPSHSFPLSLSPNLKCLPSFSSFSPLSPSSASLSPHPSAALSPQNHVKEVFELEHLMEILVES